MIIFILLGRGYDHNYNFFDPDNFMTLSAILYSGDEYLQDQARLIIERTGEFILESTGQIPHHFSGLKPTYSALSGKYSVIGMMLLMYIYI